MSVLLQKSTPCGRFKVTIEAITPSNALMLDRRDCATSAKDLSDLLMEAATVALQLAVTIMEPTHP